MTQDNTPIDPVRPNPPPNAPPATGKSPAPPPRKKRRWLRRVLLAIVVLIVLLLILAGITPMLLSTDAGKSFVLGKINQNLNGHVTIDSWKIGWTGGIHVDGVRVFNEENGQILQLPHFTTQLSLLDAMRGKIHLGDTRIDGLDFVAVQYPDGSTNFSRLIKNQTSSETASRSETNARAQDKKSEGKSTKLPVVDGEIQLINCGGTSESIPPPGANDKSGREEKGSRYIKFTKIAGDVKIPGINDTIQDSLSIVAVDYTGKQIASFSADGKLQIAKDNLLLTPGQMKIEQKLTTAADLKGIWPLLANFTNADVQFTSGVIDGSIVISNGANGITVTPAIPGKDLAFTDKNGPHKIGDIYLGGSANLSSPQGASAASAVTDISFANLTIMGLGSGAKINGSIADVTGGCSFNNLTIDLNYNLEMIWDATRPFLKPDQRETFKDVQIAGNKTEHFVLTGSLPQNKPFNEAIASLNVAGELSIDSFEGQGASLKNWVIPISLAGGKFRIAYAGKPAGQEFAPPAQLNGGSLNLAGLTVDLVPVHMTLSIPAGTKLLVNVALNPIFARTFLAKWLSSPVFSGAEKANGMASATIKQCTDLPIDALVLEDVPENKGSIELDLVMTNVEVGSKLVDQLNSALAIVNPKGRIASGGVPLSIPSFDVGIAHGITTEDMKLMVGKNPPMELAGRVVMKTNGLQMSLAIPLSRGQSIKVPISGTVDDPKLDTSGLLQKNLQNIPGVPKELKGLLGKDKNGAATQPGNQKDNPIDDILKGLNKPKNDGGSK